MTNFKSFFDRITPVAGSIPFDEKMPIDVAIAYENVLHEKRTYLINVLKTIYEKSIETVLAGTSKRHRDITLISDILKLSWTGKIEPDFYNYVINLYVVERNLAKVYEKKYSRVEYEELSYQYFEGKQPNDKSAIEYEELVTV